MKNFEVENYCKIISGFNKKYITMNKKIIIIFFLIISTFSLKAQNDIELVIQFISNEDLGYINFELDAFFEYAKIFGENCKTYLKDETKPSDVGVMVTFHKTEEPSIEIFGRGEFDTNFLTNLKVELTKIEPINSLFVDFTLVYFFFINGGALNQDENFYPEPIFAQNVEIEKLEKC